MIKKKDVYRFIYLIILLLIILIIFQLLGLDKNNLSEEKIQELAKDNIYLLLTILFGVMFFQNLLNFFPIVLVISLNVSLLGMWTGFIFSLFCSVMASTIIFLIIRYLFIDMKASPKYEKYTRKIEQNGFLYVLIARLIPIFPTNVINIASGLSSIKTTHYVFATISGHAFYILVISVISFNILN